MGLKFGDISPVAGMVTGEGMTGNLIRQGVGGFLPQMIAKDAYDSKQQSIANKAQEDEKNAQAAAQEAAMAAKQQKAEQARNYVSSARETGGLEGYKSYKKGGKVKSASARADGCCIRGKTRA